MKIANVQKMVFIDKLIIHVVSHLYTWYQSYKTVVPQVILNFKWSSNEECSLTSKSSSLANGWPMQWLRGRCPTNWYQGQRSYVWYLKSYTSSVIPIYVVVSIKKCKIQVSTIYPNATLCIKICTPFIEIDDKGGEIGTNIWNMQEALGRNWIWSWIWSKRDNIEKWRRIKILGQKGAHK